MKNPVVTGDSLVGTGAGGVRVAIGLADVQDVSVRRSAAGRTAMLIFAGAVTWAAAFAWLLSVSYGRAST